jgi:hypothetical protein
MRSWCAWVHDSIRPDAQPPSKKVPELHPRAECDAERHRTNQPSKFWSIIVIPTIDRAFPLKAFPEYDRFSVWQNDGVTGVAEVSARATRCENRHTRRAAVLLLSLLRNRTRLFTSE